MPLLNDGRDSGGTGRDLASSGRVELALPPRGEQYRRSDIAEKTGAKSEIVSPGLLSGLAPGLTRGLTRGQTRPGSGLTRRPASEPAACGNPSCRSTWTLPWKSRRYPIFEGKWACSGRCLLALVKAAIEREIGDGRREAAQSQHQHRLPLGLLILSQGWITHPQLQCALEAQRAKGAGRIGQWLISECGLDAEIVTRGLSAQWGCPVLTTEGFSPAAMALALPRVFLEKFGILPLRVAGSKILYVGFEDHLDASSAFAAERMSGLRTESGVVVEGSFREARQRLLACKFAPLTECRVPDGDTLAKAIATVIDHRSTAASRLVRLRQYYWLRVWTASGGGTRGGKLPEHPEDARDVLFTIG